MKKSISINDELCLRVEKFAADNYMSFSGLVSSALSEYMTARESVVLLKKVCALLEVVADRTKPNEEQSAALDELNLLVKMFSQNGGV